MSTRSRLTLAAVVVFTAAALVAFIGVFLVIQNFPTAAVDRGEFPRRHEVLLMVEVGAAVSVVIFASIGAIFAWVLAGTLLRPLDRIRAAAMKAANGDLTQRLNSRRSDEFGRLADTFDVMLARLEDALGIHERFAANAAHELRTPLATIRTLLEVHRRNPDRARVDELLHQLEILNERMIETCRALLELSDANRATMRHDTITVTTILNDAAEETRQELRPTGRSLRIIGGDAAVIGDAQLLRHALRNLLENAARHGTGTITVEVIDDGHHVSITVSNGGPALAPELVARLTEPFLRGSGRIGNGHGLGLTLVAHVAAAHEGTVQLTPRLGGGLIAELQLPAAATGH